VASVRSTDDRCPASPTLLNRPGTDSRRVSAKAQLLTGAVIFGLSAWLTVASVSWLGSRHQLSDTVAQIRGLEQAYADLLAESQLSTTSFMAQLDELKGANERQRGALDELSTIQETLGRQLASRERQLATVTEQRDHARARLGDLELAMAQVKGLMGDTLDAKAAVDARLAETSQRLVEVSRQRDAERQVEVGLRWQVARLEDEVQQLRSRRETAQIWLKDWVLGSTEALEQLFVETGVNVEDLVQRIGSGELGQGGPLQLAGLDPDERGHGQALPGDPIRTDIQRLAALQRLARSLPLASPLDHFSLSSGFGKRRDPFTRSWAFHSGLDFSAAAGSQVLATSPGRVTYAGPAGPYGNMVELDHGMGIVTRYGHLKKIDVAVGDEIHFRQELGVIGSTGRSTGLHLHYEVRIDDVAYDPARFLDAGRLLVGVFANAGATDGG
jgi:murein DD-endopeptidase MepM/ murein hydrolase activator NlpD